MPPLRDTSGDQLNASHLPHSQTLSSAERISLAVRGSLIGSLWLQTLAEPSERGSIPAGIDRNLTPDNLRIALKLLPLLLRSALGALRGKRRHALIGFFARQLLVGLVPAAAIWVQAQLMDMVQFSVSSGHVEWAQMAFLTVLNLLLSSFHDIYRYLAEISDSNAECDINEGLERAYASAQMSLSIPCLASPEVQALMREGAVFIGQRAYQNRSGGSTYPGAPFAHIEQLLDAGHGITRIISLSAILVRAIFASARGPSRWIFIALCIGPTALRVAGGLFFNLTYRRTYRTHLARGKWLAQEHWLKELGKDGVYKQENVLFGLRDWVLDRLDGVRKDMRESAIKHMERNQAANLYLGIGQNSIEAVFYIAMVSQVFGNAISLGTARLCQAVSADLARAMRSLGDDMERSFQAIFYVAAFIQITQLPRDLYAQADPDRSVEYDTTRPLSGGMNIVARNLSFSYPRQTKPALRNIDLTIPAGQTLAIVGFNGGGKTTLVKVLMGLYDYGGELLINGVSARSIDKQSLYARTSCLFQDYNRYPVTVRENVGVGRVDKMNDKEAILRAMERGKADAVVRHVGSVEAILAPEELQESSAMGNDDEEDEGRDKAKPSGGGDAGAAKAAGEADESGKVATAEKEETGSAVVNGEDPERQLSTEQEKMNRKETYHALSGGQWQRIALARAFLRAEDADLVVFDEPSSSLDPRAEAALFERIHTLSIAGAQKPTTIYISHRFSTVRKADQIAVVEDGTIIEVGSHTELMRLDGRYAELFSLQKEGYESD